MKIGPLTKKLQKQIVLGDGAMGTMIYHEGVFVNQCFDQLNLTNPELIIKIHQQYIEAGADFIETNTFGANELKLAKFGLAQQCQQINSAAVELAQTAAKNAGIKTLIAGAIGPLGIDRIKYSDKKNRAMEAFENQAQMLKNAGVDFLILETFSNSNELVIAVEAAKKSGLEVVAQLTITNSEETAYGEKITGAIAKIAAMDNVTAVGLNCSIGPFDMLQAIDNIRKVTDKPIAIQPNAGMPKQIDNRTIYMSTPEYMAEYAKRFMEKGVKIIGGCCGTTPEHIKKIVQTIRPLDKATTSKIALSVTTEIVKKEKLIRPKLQNKSNLGKKIADGKKVTAIEITPPKGLDIKSIIEKAKLCANAGIDAINIPDGPRASSRLSPIVTAAKIQEQANIETILHFCCRDKNLIGIQSDILGAYALGIKNLLIITGDPPKIGKYPDATGVFDLDSVALTEVVQNLNCGMDIGANKLEPTISMTVAVGANPVATEMAREIQRFRQKVAAGAEYAITQPVFDKQNLISFLEATEDCKIPVIAGIWPFTSFKNAEFMANEVPGVVVPKNIMDKMSKAKTKEQGRQIGIEIAQNMVEEIKDIVEGFAVSAPFGNVKIALAVLGKIDSSEI